MTHELNTGQLIRSLQYLVVQRVDFKNSSKVRTRLLCSPTRSADLLGASVVYDRVPYGTEPRSAGASAPFGNLERLETRFIEHDPFVSNPLTLFYLQTSSSAAIR